MTVGGNQDYGSKSTTTTPNFRQIPSTKIKEANFKF